MQYDVIINFLTEVLLWKKSTLEWKVRSLCPRLVRKQDVAKERGLQPKFNAFKIRVKLWRHGEETNVTQPYHGRGSGDGAIVVII